MAKIVVVGSFGESLIKFRGPLLQQMVENGHEVIACAPEADDELTSELALLGVKYIPVPIGRAGINPVKDLRTVFSLWCLFLRLKPDIFLGYTIKPVIYGSLAAFLARVPSRFSMITGLGYAFVATGLKARAVRLVASSLYKFALVCNHRVFFQNVDDRELFIELGILKREGLSTIINGSGVELAVFQATPLGAGCRFLLIARLLIDKGVREYVAAAGLIKGKYPEVEFDLAGWLDQNPSTIKKEELDDWVASGLINFLGKLDDVRPAIARSTVYVLPSYREGTPRTVLEAMAMGRAIITTDAPGCRQTVKEGVNGFLVPVKSVGGLVEAMEQFIVSPKLAVEMGARSRELAERKYDVLLVNNAIQQGMGIL